LKQKKQQRSRFSAMTVADLRQIAKDRGLTGYSTLKKQELIDLLNQNND
jgi:hypothetical protein